VNGCPGDPVISRLVPALISSVLIGKMLCARRRMDTGFGGCLNIEHVMQWYAYESKSVEVLSGEYQ
jgi:hypothetical protein